MRSQPAVSTETPKRRPNTQLPRNRRDRPVNPFIYFSPRAIHDDLGLALPAAFPHRDPIVLTAFSVVFGTLVIQGLTLKPLLRALNLHDDDPVGRKVRAARDRALHAGLASFTHDQSPIAEVVRRQLRANLAAEQPAETFDAARSDHGQIHRGALRAAREAVLAMRAHDEIGDDAFHQIEEELDWLDMSSRSKAE